jgi:hypothetical protein
MTNPRPNCAASRCNLADALEPLGVAATIAKIVERNDRQKEQ